MIRFDNGMVVGTGRFGLQFGFSRITFILFFYILYTLTSLLLAMTSFKVDGFIPFQVGLSGYVTIIV